jgi:hypothetical protein
VYRRFAGGVSSQVSQTRELKVTLSHNAGDVSDCTALEAMFRLAAVPNAFWPMRCSATIPKISTGSSGTKYFAGNSGIADYAVQKMLVSGLSQLTCINSPSVPLQCACSLVPERHHPRSGNNFSLYLEHKTLLTSSAETFLRFAAGTSPLPSPISDDLSDTCSRGISTSRLYG